METVQYYKIQSLLSSISELYVKTIEKVPEEDFNMPLSQSKCYKFIKTDVNSNYICMKGDFKTSSNIALQTNTNTKEKNIIKSVLDIYDSLNHLSLKLENEKYIEYKEKLIDYLIQIKSFVKSKEVCNIDEELIRKHFDFKMETLQIVDKNIKAINYNINIESETKANEMKELGNKQFTDGYFKKSIDLFESALQIDGLSNLTKSILHSNIALAKFSNHTLSQNKATENIENSNNSLEVYYEICNAHGEAVNSIESRPCWFKPYITLAKIRSRLSNYQQSINICDAALHLLQTFPPPSLTIDSILTTKNEIERIRNDAIGKLGQEVYNNIGKRDYNQETINKLKCYNNLLTRSFYGKSITNELIQKHGLNIVQNFIYVNDRPFLEASILHKALEYKKNGNFEGAIELLSVLIGNGTQHSMAYFGLPDLLKERQILTGESFDHSLYMALLLKSFAVEKNIVNDIMCSHAYILTCCLLGSIYKSGLFGMDIDIEKSMYYFGESAKKAEKYKGKNFNGFSHLILGYHHLCGITSNQSITSSIIIENVSKSKAGEYLIEGIELGSKMCRDLLDSILENE